MFEKYESSLNYKPLSLNEIYSYQNEIFHYYLGIYPNHEVRLLSPFQSDSNPGCRFEYYDSLWWFVDNKTYNGKLYFNCIDFVKAYEGVDFQDAIKIIKSILNLEEKPIKNVQSKVKYDIKIRFTYKDWSSSNYFSDNYNIDHTYLNLQPYYNVDNYWCSTKDDLTLIYNRFGKPKNRIAYYFDTGKTKLYFPDNTINDVKWYANTYNEIFGFHRMSEYLESGYKSICICSSGKDEMCLNYHTQIPTLGLQSETSIIIPDSVLESLKYFDTIYIWLDADVTGYTYTHNLENFLLKYFKNVIPVFHNKKYGKDIGELIENKIDLFNMTKTIFV